MSSKPDILLLCC